MTWTEVPLWEDPASEVYMAAYWAERSGWTLTCSSRVAGAPWLAQGRYDRLTTAELLDVLDGAAAKLRGF